MRKFLVAILVVLAVGAAAGGAVYVLSQPQNQPLPAAEYPEYVSFDGYVFTPPKNFSVDEQSVLGAQLVYTGQVQAATVEDVYNQNGIAVQAVANLPDHNYREFKNFVNKTYVPDVKKNLGASQATVKFGKLNGADTATISLKKDGQQVRAIMLKGGKHSVSVVAKTDSDAFKKIAGTITDVETSDMHDEYDNLRQAVQNNLQLAKSQKAQDLYNGASSDLRAKSTLAQLTAALSGASSFFNQNIVVGGGSYLTGEFTAALRFNPASTTDRPSFGTIGLKKVDNKWTLEQLGLPAKKS